MTTHLQSHPAQTAPQPEQSGLVEALRPFAAIAEAYDDAEADSHEVWTDAIMDDSVRLNLGQCRKARAALSAVTAPQPEQSQAATDVLAERRRQIEAEGWTPEHDDAHNAAELGDAAACYALWAGGINPANWSQFWPWGHSWLKHSEPRRMLVKAGALILAEIERLDRLQTGSPEGLLRSAQGGAE